MIRRFCAILFLIPSTLYAATLPTVNVSAKRLLKLPFEERVDVVFKEAEQPHSLRDMFNEQSSVNLKQSGPLGSQTSVFIRGGNSDHTRVMVDGMRVNDPTTNSYDAGGFLPQTFDTAILSKGAQSQMGADAMSGALAFTLDKGEDAFKHTFQTSVGSYGTQSGAYRLKGGYKRAHGNINLAGLKSQGFVVKPPALRTTSRDHLTNKSQAFSFHSRLDGNLTDRTTLTLFNRAENNLHYFGKKTSNTSTSNTFWRGQRQKSQHVLKLNHEHDLFQGKLIHSFMVGRYETMNKDRNVFAPEKPEEPATKNHGKRDLLAYRPVLNREHTKVETAFEYEEDSLDAFNLGSITMKTAGAKARTLSAMASPQHRFILPHNQAFTAFGTLRHDRHSMFGETHNYRYGGTYELPTKTELSASYGTAYKAPALYQLFVNNNYTQANPKLRPERTRSIQYGIAQPLPFGFRVEVTYFKNRLQNLIEITPLSSEKWSSANTNRAKISGFESAIKWSRGCWKTILSHTYLYTQDSTTKLPLFRRPKNVMTFGVHYHEGDWKVGMHGSYQTRPVDIDPVTYNRVRGKPVKTLDAYGAYQINKRIEAQLKLENMFGYRNEDPLGYQKTGFAIYGGVKVEI